MNKISLFTVRVAVIAAVYAALTVVLGPLAYGEIQVRISDAMLILPLLPGFGFDAVIGLTIGGFLANLASPFGYIDWLFGPIANFIATMIVYLSKKVAMNDKIRLVIALIGSIIAISLIIGYGELHLVFGIPVIVVFYVFIGEVISIGIGGSIVYFTALKRIHHE